MQQENEKIERARGVGAAGKRVAGVHGAWKALRPEKAFYGMTLEEFEAHVQPFKDVIAEIEDLRSQLAHAYWKRDAEAAEAMRVVQGVVASVKGDSTEGEDGVLYSAMGYIPLSRRKSGLKRR